MGVHGLWKLLEPSGQMVPLESLAGKVIAVDVSIWLHQAIKGMHDTYGAPMEAAHLIILFHRLCKLLFYKIKPVFVFDGGVPALKHQTLAARRQQTTVAKNEVLKVREKLIKNLLKHEAVRQVLSNETASAALGLNSFALPGPSVEEDLYKLPPIAADAESASSEEMEEDAVDEDEEKRFENIHSVDITSKEFLSLPPEVRHDILTELIETRKQSSWKYLDSMPADSDDFSDFQMNRLLKRRAVQTSLEVAGKEMGGRNLSYKELESVLRESGNIVSENACLPTRRIAQDNITRFMLIQNDSADDSGSSEVKKKDEKEFDIMKRLDEVGWSSESDTDVILETSKKGKSADTKPEVDSGISRRPVVQMTKEMADILNILEDDDVEPDVKIKVQELQNKFSLTSTRLTIQEEPQHAVEDSEVTLKAIQKDSSEVNFDSRPEEDILKELKGKLEDDVPVSAGSKIEVKLEHPEVPQLEGSIDSVKVDAGIEKPETTKYFKVSEQKTSNPIHIEDIKEIEPSPPPTPETALQNVVPEQEASQMNVETPISPSSSDSDDDLVAIGTSLVDERPNSKDIEDTIEKSVTHKSKTDTPETLQTLSITVSPSKIKAEDDIFADLFQASPEVKAIENVMGRVEEKQVENALVEPEVVPVTTAPAADKSVKLKEMTAEELNELKKSLEEQQFDLMMEKGKQERQALNPTDQMYSDAQELLRLFGVPFVVAPMEAEAQCACLDTLGLTEGTITDDSDIWLFGGRIVYKNFFNQKKHVLEYRAVNIQKYFKLNREDLIRLAMLVGSDYTVGLNGIGPVTALEILASFPSSRGSLFDGLEMFRDWFTGRNQATSPRTSLKRKIRNTVISPGFPNRAVADAYLHPQVDDSREPFSWAKPNVDLIKKYVKVKIGWSPDRCNSLLLPILKKMEESSSQSVMERYLQGVPNTVGVLSKRVEKAIKRLEGIEEEEGEPKPKKMRKVVAPKSVEGDGDDGKKGKRGRKAKKVEGDVEESPEATSLYFVESKPVSGGLSKSEEGSKESLIKEKLHREETIPQRVQAQKILEERKKEAIQIFRTFKGRGKKKRKVFAKEANLSESSSDGD